MIRSTEAIGFRSLIGMQLVVSVDVWLPLEVVRRLVRLIRWMGVWLKRSPRDSVGTGANRGSTS